MSPKEKSNIERRQFWQRALEAHRQSGLSVAAFCKKEGLSETAYYYWRRKRAGGVLPAKEPLSPDFLEVVVAGRPNAALELVFSGGHTLRIHPGADQNLLSQVFSALRQAGLC